MTLCASGKFGADVLPPSSAILARRTRFRAQALSRLNTIILSTLTPQSIGHGAHRWRNWIAACALVALAWPSLGPLPWVIGDFDGHRHAAAGHHHAGEALHHDDQFDGSSIPGSPTHPINHDCPECQVLKHLSRCVLPAFAVGVIPPPFICDVSPRISVALPPTQVTAHLPPARAPPEAAA
jgi:hypothetical protein